MRNTPAGIEIWNRAIEPELSNLSEEAARALLRLDFSEADRKRISELSAKANEGTLADGEAEVLDRLLNIGSALDILQAKARLTLKSAA